MESISFSLSPMIFTFFAIFLSFFFFFFFISSSSIRLWKSRNHSGDHDKKTVPLASGSWPLLGHLPHLAGKVPPHLVLAKMADRCGSMFTIKLGVHPAIVVNTWEIAKEFLTTHDRTFATRPRSMSSDVMTYNYATFGLSPYGPYWRHIRKITTLELLSNHRLELLKHVRESEVQASIQDAYMRWSNNIGTASTVLVDMKRWFADSGLNIIFRMIIGKRFSEGGLDEKGRECMRAWTELAGRFVVSDGLPYLRWLDFGGYERAMHKISKELDVELERWLDEHKAKRKQCGDKGIAEGNQDFMDVLLDRLEDNQEVHGYDADTVNKATCLTMVLAGSDSSTVTLIWALSLLLNHKESLKKVQQELDAVVGKDRQVNELDYKNLPYLQAVIKETMRLYPAVPLAIPHEATEDCTVQAAAAAAYFIPKGTRLLFNLHKIQRDSRVWPNPNEFHPERFLTTHKDFDVMGHNFGLIPFGSGRRICPGIAMALSVVGLTLASFLQAFHVQTPGDELVDMSASIGFTNVKAGPLQVLIKPRLPDRLYVPVIKSM